MPDLPTTSRPPQFTYRFRNLRNLPARIFCPTDAGVGTVRSFRIVPKYDVKLDDVLNGRHLPPLGLKEFEEYLLFVEQSVENLYFWAWLKKYDETFALHAEAVAASNNDNRSTVKREMDLARQLRESYACAHATFLAPNAPMQLNLTEDAVTRTPIPPLPSALHDEPISPESLAPVKKQVLDMLQLSLQSFVVGNCRNGGRRRGLFAIIVGLLTCLVGLAPILRSFDTNPRGDRRFLSFAAFPCLWLGLTTLIAGFHGVCIVIFMFGDARQLHPYEMVRPTEEDIAQMRRSLSLRLSQKAQGISLASSTNSSPGGDQTVFEMKPPGLEQFACAELFDADASSTPHAVTGSDARTHSMLVPIDVALPSASSSSTNAIAPWLASPGPSSALSSGTFDWEIASSNASMLARKRSIADEPKGLFAPMQQALSPIVSRAQWSVMMRSGFIGLVGGLIVSGICAAPFPSS